MVSKMLPSLFIFRSSQWLSALISRVTQHHPHTQALMSPLPVRDPVQKHGDQNRHHFYLQRESWQVSVSSAVHFSQSARKCTSSKTTLIICTSQRKPLFLICLFQFISSLWYHSLSTHTVTHRHSYNAGKTNALLICPPQGFAGSLWNLCLSRQKSTWKWNKGPAPHFTLLFNKVCCTERHTEQDYTHTCTHIHKPVSALPQTPSHLPKATLIWFWSQTEKYESLAASNKYHFKHNINHALWKFQLCQ